MMFEFERVHFSIVLRSDIGCALTKLAFRLPIWRCIALVSHCFWIMAGKHTKCSLGLSSCSYTSVFTSVCKADYDGYGGVILVRLTLALTLLVAISAQIGGLIPLFQNFIEAGYGYNFHSLQVMLAAAFSFKVLRDMFETIDIISWMIAATKLEDPEDLDGGEKNVLLGCEGKFFGYLDLKIRLFVFVSYWSISGYWGCVFVFLHFVGKSKALSFSWFLKWPWNAFWECSATIAFSFPRTIRPHVWRVCTCSYWANWTSSSTTPWHPRASWKKWSRWP